ncbi:MAG: DUF4129 domain-containing protein [Blastocatellia bacterium]
MRRFAKTWPGLCLVLLTPMLLVWAATPFTEYASRVSQAAVMTRGRSAGVDSREEMDAATREAIRNTLRTVRQMLPATEEIEFAGKVVHADNTWLHEETKKTARPDDKSVEKNEAAAADPDPEEETSETDVASYAKLSPADRALVDELRMVAHRLSALEQRLNEAGGAQKNGDGAAFRERLDHILSRPEYQEALDRESTLQRWLRQLQEKLLEWWIRWFGGRRSQGNAGSGGLDLFRILLLMFIAGAIAFGLVRLARQYQRRVRPVDDNGPREILGELIEEGTTADDLFRNAAKLARRGEHRLAIRRAYLALLYELEQRGKIRLHRAKTNRDYLGEVRDEKYIYEPVEFMTLSFERAWYGETRATLDDYSSFVERYREVVTPR